MDADDVRPFSLEGEYQSFGEAFPAVASLSVTIRAVNLVRDTVEMRQYGESDVPSHADCPNCGHENAVGWALAGVVDREESDFQVTQPCQGLERVGRSCPYGFVLEGSVGYDGR